MSGRAQTASPTVLLVEHFNETRLVLRIALELSGYRVVEAADGSEAVEAARRERPDLVLLDIGLPVMNGLAAARAIRQETGLDGTLIVVIAAQGTPKQRIEAAAVECDGYVTKPVQLPRLKELLDRLLAARAAAVDTQPCNARQREGRPESVRVRAP